MKNISILIPTFNEEKNIRHALESVKWSDDVFVVDSFSTDKTKEIAESYPNVKKVHQRAFDNYSKNKNWALDNFGFSNEWIFILDADEQVTPELKKEILEIANNQETEQAGFYVNRKFIFLGKWIKRCGWYPSWNLRFFRNGRARYEERSVNEHMVVNGKTGYLKNDMLHQDHKGIHAWLEKHNRYSLLEAQEFLKKQETGLKVSFFGDSVQKKRFLKEKVLAKLPFKPFLVFLYLYFLRLGILDGKVGFEFCVLRAMYQFQIDLKVKELKNENS